MSQSDPAVDKYWVTQSGYFRLATTVELGMMIIYGNIILCHGISEGSEDNIFLTREYNYRTVYECFNNNFLYDFVIPNFNLPPINIDNSPHPDIRYRYTPDLIPYAISVASEKSVSTLTTPSNSPQLPVVTSNDTKPHHSTNK